MQAIHLPDGQPHVCMRPEVSKEEVSHHPLGLCLLLRYLRLLLVSLSGREDFLPSSDPLKAEEQAVRGSRKDS